MTPRDEAVVRAALRDFDRANDRLSRRGTLTAADRQAAAGYTKAAGDKLAALLDRLAQDRRLAHSGQGNKPADG